MDATYFELEQAALECSLVSYRQQEHGKKIRASTSNSKGGKESETVASGESNMAQSSIAREVASATELANVSLSNVVQFLLMIYFRLMDPDVFHYNLSSIFVPSHVHSNVAPATSAHMKLRSPPLRFPSQRLPLRLRCRLEEATLL